MHEKGIIHQVGAGVRAFFTRSIFRRMYLLYALIILLSVSILGLWQANNMADLIVTQTLEYNAQQLASLHDVFRSQLQLISHVKSRLYEVGTGAQTNLYNSVAIVLKDNKPFVSEEEYNAFIYHASLIHTFFGIAQNALPTKMDIFQINGSVSGQGSVNILWPLQNLANIGDAQEVHARIAAHDAKQDDGLLSFTAAEGTSRARNFYVLYDTLNDPTSDAVTGYLINGYSSTNLDSVLAQYDYPLEGVAYILSADGTVLYDSDHLQEGHVAPFYERLAQANFTSFEESGQLYNVLAGPKARYYVVGHTERALLSAKATRSNRTILAFSLGCALVAVVLTLLSTRTLTRRVRAMRKTMKEAQAGNLQVRAHVSGTGDEIDQIAGSLNRMIERLDEHIQAEYVSELQKSSALIRQREAELIALQHQVNPHFLYNTLEVIRMRAVENDDEDTALLIRWLASLFRRRTHTSIVITIGEELSDCDALTNILRAKFSGEINVVLNVPDEIQHYAILKDIIQPPLENAFIHGFTAGMDEERLIRIDGEMIGGDILLRVHNNGAAIQPEVLASIQARLQQDTPQEENGGSHIGLVNVHHRIRLAYGEAYGVSIASSEAEGTTVTLTIRALSHEELQARITPRNPYQ